MRCLALLGALVVTAPAVAHADLWVLIPDQGCVLVVLECGDGGGCDDGGVCVADPDLAIDVRWCLPHNAVLCPDDGGLCPPKTTMQLDADQNTICVPDQGDPNCVVNLDEPLRVGATVDFDGDGVPNISDNCICDENPWQEDLDCDGFGGACDDNSCPDFEEAGIGDLIPDRFFGRECCAFDLNGDGQIDRDDLDSSCGCEFADGITPPLTPVCDGVAAECVAPDAGGDGDADADADADADGDTDADADADGDTDADADADADGDNDADVDSDSDGDADAVPPLEFHGGGGCNCSVAEGKRALGAAGGTVLAVALTLFVRRRRR